MLIEDTFDWYAQDEEGNVWYFGEDTKELDENGNVVSTEGSWEAGVNGAEPGIIMLAEPKKGDKYQQENAPDVAEDMAQVIGFEDSVCVPYGCFEDVLVTKEWTPLEQGMVEHKYYAQGVGFIFGEMVKGGEEQIELVRVRFHNSIYNRYVRRKCRPKVCTFVLSLASLSSSKSFLIFNLSSLGPLSESTVL